MYDRSRGILYIILSSLGFATMNFFVTLSGDIPFAEKVIFRNVVSLVIALAIVLREHAAFPKGRKTWGIMLLRCTLGTAGLYCNFYALGHLMLSDASMLNKLSPFFMLLFSAWFLKEKITPVHVLLIVGAFLGSLCIIKPSFHDANFFPAMIGFLGGVCAGGAYTCVRSLGKRDVAGPIIVFCFSLFSTLVTIPLCIPVAVPLSGKTWLYLLLTGLFASVGQFFVTAAYRYAPSREISIYDYSNIIFAALLGFLFLGQVPDLLSVVGYLIIFTMALLMFRYHACPHAQQKV